MLNNIDDIILLFSNYLKKNFKQYSRIMRQGIYEKINYNCYKIICSKCQPKSSISLLVSYPTMPPICHNCNNLVRFNNLPSSLWEETINSAKKEDYIKLQLRLTKILVSHLDNYSIKEKNHMLKLVTLLNEDIKFPFIMIL